MLVDAAQLIAHRPIDMLEERHRRPGFFRAQDLCTIWVWCVDPAKVSFPNGSRRILNGLKESVRKILPGSSPWHGMLRPAVKIGMDNVEEDERELTLQLLEGLRIVGGFESIWHPRMPITPECTAAAGWSPWTFTGYAL